MVRTQFVLFARDVACFGRNISEKCVKLAEDTHSKFHAVLILLWEIEELLAVKRGSTEQDWSEQRVISGRCSQFTRPNQSWKNMENIHPWKAEHSQLHQQLVLRGFGLAS